jgi:hypothetical protein
MVVSLLVVLVWWQLPVMVRGKLLVILLVGIKLHMVVLLLMLILVVL